MRRLLLPFLVSRFDKTSLDQALDLVRGAAVGDPRGSRNGPRYSSRPYWDSLTFLSHAQVGKGALRWRVSDATALHASVSSPTRFPTSLGAVQLPLGRRVADRSIVDKWGA